MIAANLGHYRKAVSFLDEAVCLDPSEHNIFNAGYVLYVAGDFRAARQRFTEMLGTVPASFRAHMMLGAVDQAVGDYVAARSAYQQAISLEPKSLLGHLFLGKLLMLLGDVRSAVGSFKTVMDLDPSFAEGNYYCGLALKQSGDKAQTVQAIDYLRAATRLKPTLAPAFLELGKTLLGLQRIKEAGEALRQARSIDPDSPSIRYALSQYSERSGILRARRRKLNGLPC